jgi:predicted phage-related endonuclease
MRETVELKPEALEIRRRRDAAAADTKAAKQRQEQAENELKLLLGDAEVGTIDERPIVRWSRVTQHRLDVDRLRQRRPRTVAQYMKETSFRRFSFPRLEER